MCIQCRFDLDSMAGVLCGCYDREVILLISCAQGLDDVIRSRCGLLADAFCGN